MDNVESLYNSLLLGEGYTDPIYFSEDQERQTKLLQGEVGEYYAELLRQAKGDYNEAVKRLSDDYRQGYGQGNEQLLTKLNDAARVLDANVGRLGADTQLAMSQAQEDRDLLKKNVETQRTRLTDDTATAMNQLALESGELERDAGRQTESLEFDQGARGAYSGGVVDKEKGDLQARIDSLRQRIQARKQEVEKGTARGMEDLSTQESSIDRAFNRTEQGLGINERRAREDALRSFSTGKEDLSKQYERPYTGVLDQLSGEKAGALQRAGSLVTDKFAEEDRLATQRKLSDYYK